MPLWRTALADTAGSATEATYFRSDLLELRRRLMDEWSDFLEEPQLFVSIVYCECFGVGVAVGRKEKLTVIEPSTHGPTLRQRLRLLQHRHRRLLLLVRRVTVPPQYPTHQPPQVRPHVLP